MGKEAKAKAPKDPNAPKKPLGAYMLFSKDMRKVVMEENPSAGFGEVGKILGAKWKECDEKTKKVRPVVWQRVGNTAWEERQGLGEKCGAGWPARGRTTPLASWPVALHVCGATRQARARARRAGTRCSRRG
jgi:hypothetical protein